MCTLDGSRSAARWYASSASAVWLLQDSYCTIVSGEFQSRDMEVLTNVPRSYQTSEMLGLRRIAREYASNASRYWLIW
jgi:hypothetical protein